MPRKPPVQSKSPKRRVPRKKSPQRKHGAALDSYWAKRDFAKTPEPKGLEAASSGYSFVVQEHHARNHHFDFRLEMSGVLVSWAVPKGVPEDQAASRLAVHVEDHPLEYGTFEGDIPAGNYGAGKVKVFDSGRWKPVDPNWEVSFQRGKLKFSLEGRRLRGTYLLVRLGEEPNWLLRLISKANPENLPSSCQKEKAHFIAPQLARLVQTVPQDPSWLHELKFDGYRLIVVRREGEVRIFTRNQIDWTAKFRPLVTHFESRGGGDFVVDGEAVVFDTKGRSRFGALQAALKSGKHEQLSFVAFDLLHLDGVSLRKLPFTERLERLARWMGEENDTIRLSKHWPGALGGELFREACHNQLEGIISKPRHGFYQEGSRIGWVKSKCRARQEFVICGYTPPSGTRTGFGALVLGAYEGDTLVSRGKVGTGFSEAEREELLDRFAPLHRKEAPFTFMGQVQWLKPELVAEVEFAEITRDGAIRQGNFVALREDKTPRQVGLDKEPRTNKRANAMVVNGIAISHPDRIVYPEDGISKLEVVEYYARCAHLMLPFVAHRPLAVLRAPDGIAGSVFFQKSFPKHLPAHVHQTKLDDGTAVFYVTQTAGLISLAQFGVIEFHPWGATFDQVEKPDLLIWDLDPDAGVSLHELLGAALLLRDYLSERGLTTVVKTSGGKGFHLVAKVTRRYEWTIMRPFAKAVSEAVAQMNAKRFTTKAAKAGRSGKIFIDWLRNGRGATCIAPWSLRARPGCTVSMPADWAELDTLKPDSFTIASPLDNPEEWSALKPQTIPVSLLRELGVLQ